MRARPLEGSKDRDDPPDLRLVPVAAALWGGTLAGVSLAPAVAVAVVAPFAVAAVGLAWRWRGGTRALCLLTAACLTAGMVAGIARAVQVRQGPVADLAGEEAYVEVSGVVAADPQPSPAIGATARSDDAADRVLVRVRIDEITGRGQTHRVRTPVLVSATGGVWPDILPGQRVQLTGRLGPADRDIAAFLRVRGDPVKLGEPGLVARATEPFRAGLRDAVRAVPGEHRGLIPGMVVGDESLISGELREQMRTTGLTHLTAVSGTHVSIVLLAVTALARLCGARSYALPLVSLLAVAGFVLLVRPEPSVLRAAVMGSVAVVGILVTGRRHAVPALAAAVGVLVLIDPWLAASVGFVLSVSATAGIVVLVPRWERSMRWLPRPLALALAVPLAAQVACTPVLVGAFGQFSVASVPANMMVAPVVAVAMVAGLAAAVLSVALPGVAAAVAWVAGVPTWWIAAIAEWLAERPGAEFTWPDGLTGGLMGTAAAVLSLVLVPLLLRQWVAAVMLAGVVALVLFRPVPVPGWPPPDWLVVACDVGQGDGFVVRAGPGSAVVVDAGPEPAPIRDCLDSLGVVHVPMLVLSHFHTDHVGGVPGVLDGRHVDRAVVSPLGDPADQAEQVSTWLGGAGVPVVTATAGQRWRIGDDVSAEVLWPRRIIRASGESDGNNASVVLDVRARGVSMLFTGDLEPLAQRALMGAEPGLRTRILKVAHHGSSRQEEQLLTGLGAELALVSVGENLHGHPSADVLDTLTSSGVEVRRTDEDGTVAVVGVDGGVDRIGVATR